MKRIKNMVTAGLAALALAGGALAAAGPAASAATPACGASCLALASQAFGTSNVSAVFTPALPCQGRDSLSFSAAQEISAQKTGVSRSMAPSLSSTPLA
jgi:hypothetical protein